MGFDWLGSEKEKFYQKAKNQLKEAGIDFIGVDRSQFGVQGWNGQEKTVQAVFVALTAYSYQHFTSVQKGLLKKTRNWECVDKYGRRVPKPIRIELKADYCGDIVRERAVCSTIVDRSALYDCFLH